MANRIKGRVKTSYAKGFASTKYKDRGNRRGEQGKATGNGYSGGKRKKAILSEVPRKAYKKRLRAGQ